MHFPKQRDHDTLSSNKPSPFCDMFVLLMEIGFHNCKAFHGGDQCESEKLTTQGGGHFLRIIQ